MASSNTKSKTNVKELKKSKIIKRASVSTQTITKYKYYEHSVQSPNWQVDYLPQFHTWAVGKSPKIFREDFCGTAQISCEWVKRSPAHSALGLDLDTEVLDFARRENLSQLSAAQKKQVQLLQQNVLKPTKAKVDMIGAYNFSVFTFQKREELLKYFKAAYQSLNQKGTLFLEIMGGSGFQEANLERKKVKNKQLGTFIQYWDQHEYNPIAATNHYAIHFQNAQGLSLQNAFTYDWRLWGIKELREALEEAGFDKSLVLWPESDDSNEFLPRETAANMHAWVAYVVGVKK